MWSFVHGQSFDEWPSRPTNPRSADTDTADSDSDHTESDFVTDSDAHPPYSATDESALPNCLGRIKLVLRVGGQS